MAYLHRRIWSLSRQKWSIRKCWRYANENALAYELCSLDRKISNRNSSRWTCSLDKKISNRESPRRELFQQHGIQSNDINSLCSTLAHKAGFFVYSWALYLAVIALSMRQQLTSLHAKSSYGSYVVENRYNVSRVWDSQLHDAILESS